MLKKVIKKSYTGAEIILEAMKLQGVNRNVFSFAAGKIFIQ